LLIQDLLSSRWAAQPTVRRALRLNCRDWNVSTTWHGGEHDRSDRPELTVFELRSGAYEQIAHVIGGEEYRAAVPFPVTIVPSQLVTAK
jgi:hypothetical protein